MLPVLVRWEAYVRAQLKRERAARCRLLLKALLTDALQKGQHQRADLISDALWPEHRRLALA